MRYAIIILLGLPSFAAAQTPEIEAVTKAKLATLKFLSTVYDGESGGYASEPKGKPGLRATNAAVKATKYLGGKLDDQQKTSKFVLGCYDDKTGAFAEPGGQPDVTTTCIGVMAAMELGIAKEKIAKAPEHITANAKAFEDVRIGAAAFEAWGDDKGWKDWAKTRLAWRDILFEGNSGKCARDGASAIVAVNRITPALLARALEQPIGNVTNYDKQLDDGGWGKLDAKSSDMESVYRVMRAFTMCKRPPDNPAKLREFIAKHRNDDGGYATTPGGKSSASGTYYAVIVTKWLDELEKK